MQQHEFVNAVTEIGHGNHVPVFSESGWMMIERVYLSHPRISPQSATARKEIATIFAIGGMEAIATLRSQC